MLKTLKGWWRREEGSQQKPELTLAITKLMVGMMSMDGKLDDDRSEEHTSELQSHHDLVCRLLLEKKKKTQKKEK